MKKIAVIGSSGHAKVVIDMIERQGMFEIAGLIDATQPKGDKVMGYAIIGTDDDAPELITALGIDGLVVAVGDNFVRSEIVKSYEARVPHTPFVTVLHPDAVVAPSAIIGEGSVVMAGAVVNPDACIGRHCILNTRCSLDHDSVLGDFASLAPAAAVGGNAHIGAFSAISIGASLKHGVRVGAHSVVGAGAAVVDDIPEQSIAFGVPARVQRSRDVGDPYL